MDNIISYILGRILDPGEPIGEVHLQTEPLSDQMWVLKSDKKSETALVFSEEELDEWDDIENEEVSSGVAAR